MERRHTTPRHHWQQKLEALGFEFHSMDGQYWVEDAYYAFHSNEIERIEKASNELHQMCLQVVENVIQKGDYAPLGLDDQAATLIETSWEADELELYGRMDFAYDGYGQPKLLEYNADTPTSLFEAAVAQWYWLEETKVLPDQFNLIHEKLLERWKMILNPSDKVHFTGCLESIEDATTVGYLQETCNQAGFHTALLDISDIGWENRFIDLNDQPIETLFKLYPWEWMVKESFATHLKQASTRWIEPAWKQILSNKSLLPLLWQHYPNHPNLLAASHDPNQVPAPCVGKPRFGREGEGVFISERQITFAEQDTVYQSYAPLFQQAGVYALLGVWLVGDETVGLGMREDDTAITLNTSRFVPHGII